MPVDSILVSAAVVAVFVVFAGVLAWADFRSTAAALERTSSIRERLTV
jgi:hypothetical protein